MSKLKAIRGNQRTLFTELAWKGMGTNKNGWKLVDEFPDDNNMTKSVSSDVGDAKYTQLTERAKGYEADSNLAKALEFYKKAQEIKDSSFIKGKINALNTAIKSQEELNDYIANADELFTGGDFPGALELYTAAAGLVTDNDHVNHRIKECKDKIK